MPVLSYTKKFPEDFNKYLQGKGSVQRMRVL